MRRLGMTFLTGCCLLVGSVVVEAGPAAVPPLPAGVDLGALTPEELGFVNPEEVTLPTPVTPLPAEPPRANPSLTPGSDNKEVTPSPAAAAPEIAEPKLEPPPAVPTLTPEKVIQEVTAPPTAAAPEIAEPKPEPPPAAPPLTPEKVIQEVTSPPTAAAPEVSEPKTEPPPGISPAVVPFPGETSSLPASGQPGGSISVTDRTVEILVDNYTAHKVFTLMEPERLVIDFLGAKASLKDAAANARVPGIQMVRFSQYPDKVRVVFDLPKGEVPEYVIEKLANGIRVTFK